MVDQTSLYNYKELRQLKTSQVNKLDWNQTCCLEWIEIL